MRHSLSGTTLGLGYINEDCPRGEVPLLTAPGCERRPSRCPDGSGLPERFSVSCEPIWAPSVCKPGEARSPVSQGCVTVDGTGNCAKPGEYFDTVISACLPYPTDLFPPQPGVTPGPTPGPAPAPSPTPGPTPVPGGQPVPTSEAGIGPLEIGLGLLVLFGIAVAVVQSQQKHAW